jgi:hypothetical protein
VADVSSWNRSAIGAKQLQYDALAALHQQWMVQFGVSGGHDVALWTDDAEASGIFCSNYSTASNREQFLRLYERHLTLLGIQPQLAFSQSQRLETCNE